MEQAAIPGNLEADGGSKRLPWKEERLKGIEPSFKAWEAFVLPLHHSRVLAKFYVQNARLSTSDQAGCGNPPGLRKYRYNRGNWWV